MAEKIGVENIMEEKVTKSWGERAYQMQNANLGITTGGGPHLMQAFSHCWVIWR